MPLAPLKMPPGLFRAGTEYQSSGRYYDADRVRWYAGTIQPMQGWRERSETLLAGGVARAALAWRANDGTPWLGVGTPGKLYAVEAGITVTEITPAGFTTGRTDAAAAVGYGAGPYGAEAYGTPRTESSTTGILPATVWSLDTWGEFLVGVSPDDGIIYEWTLPPAATALAVSGAPTARAVVVSEERIMFALAAGGDLRRVDWSDQEDNTDWTPVATNQAGSFTLTTPGQIVTGRRSRSGVLILTSVDAWVAQYQGPPFVYGFNRVGGECGIVGPGAIASTGSFNVWMGRSGFWLFDGYVKPLDCSIHDAVFSDLNYAQVSKVVAVAQRAFGEIWFHYPGEGSREVDRAVIWNYRENTWTRAMFPRTCGDDSGVFDLPILVSPTGSLWEHEVGFSYTDFDLVDPENTTDYGVPWVEGGPVEIGSGDKTMMARKLYPDEATQGGVEATFYARFYPNGAESTYGPYNMSTPTNIRFNARQVRVRYSGNGPGDWRIGDMRIEGVAGSSR